MMNASAPAAASPAAIAAVYRVPVYNSANAAAPSNAAPAASLSAEEKAAAPAFIPAIAPTRTLPLGPLPREAGTPAFKIGAVRVTPYGFLKATAVYDTSSPNGDDFPLPGFAVAGFSAVDSGPRNSREFHLKARSSRIGTNVEWLDPSSNFTITGKFEADFEGNFSRADNRNISSARSSMLGIRLAYARIDYKYSGTDSINLLFGQDWTPFASSTLPNLLEITGAGIGFGTLYERAPQFRAGWTHDFGNGFKLMPEVAMVFPLFGNLPSAANLPFQLGFGERQGSDSARPAVEGRIVTQFQLDHAPGVAPAQIIFSGEHQTRTALVQKSAMPAAFQASPNFQNGAMVSSDSNGWTGEFQLPTRYATLIGKYYNGSDLRFFFEGQIFSNFTDATGFTGTTSVASIDGSSTVLFGTDASGNLAVAPQRPVRAQGGFVNLGLPLSRIFNANPQGRNNGWSLYFHYGLDFAKARDVCRTLGAGVFDTGGTCTSTDPAFAPRGPRHKGSLYAGTLYYKLNNWVTFAFEQSLYETYALTIARPAAAGGAPAVDLTRNPFVDGLPSRTWRDLRSEGGVIFSF